MKRLSDDDDIDSLDLESLSDEEIRFHYNRIGKECIAKEKNGSSVPKARGLLRRLAVEINKRGLAFPK